VTWEPLNSEAAKDKKRVEEFFDSDDRVIMVYARSRDVTSNILTKTHFDELKTFYESIYTFSHVTDGDTVSFTGECKKDGDNNCNIPTSPMEFYKKTDQTIDFTSLTNDAALLTRIQSGKGDPSEYTAGNGPYISISDVFGGSTPSTVT